MITHFQRIWTRWEFRYGLGILVVFFGIQIVNWNSARSLPVTTTETVVGRSAPNAAIQISTRSMALSAGELPGYTGWARPERTLAGRFTIVSFSTERPAAGSEFSITIQCKGHDDCAKANTFFFLRAYGPSVIPGRIASQEGNSYVIQFVPLDPGLYTVEIVLTFSNSPPMDRFPLPPDQNQPSYEGYLLPGFPLQVIVGTKSDEEQQQSHSRKTTQRYCSIQDLTETSSASAFSKARWKVRDKSNGPGYTSNTIDRLISDAGYVNNVNSLGMKMAYKYSSNCSLLERSAFAQYQGKKNPFHQCGKNSTVTKANINLQVIFIGDSVMRVQKNMFDGYISHLPNVETSIIELYGGYRRCQTSGPDLQVHLNEIQRRYPDDLKVILFNTGLHDIHRLCGQEWTEDRLTYMDPKMLNSGKFRCIEEYRTLVFEFATIVKNFPANLRIFQSTTAAWPKYGNFGINWPLGAQTLPLAPDAVSPFNEVAFEVLKEFSRDIQIMDGFWITYARPDNREIGTIGTKLSHPGLEVLAFMTRIFAMLILEQLCNFH